MKNIISGIQQLGVGVLDVGTAWSWYRQAFGFDVPILNSEGTADQMQKYTGNKPVRRRAILALNLNGGAGVELWQLKERPPLAAPFEIRLGDLGLNAGKLKSHDLRATQEHLQALTGADKAANVGEITSDPAGRDHFFVHDPYGNTFQVVASDDWFQHKRGYLTGGAVGAFVGVSDMEEALRFYRDMLGYDRVVYNTEGRFDDLSFVTGGNCRFHRVLLTQSEERNGAFSRLLGRGEIELILSRDFSPSKIFEGRWWGDLGFIHICFDVISMDDARKVCERAGHPFQTESNPDFEMGDADGQFAYIEDPDGTLIEFVETHKIPVMKKIGWYLNLRKRDKTKPLPDFVLKALQFARVR